MTAPDSPRSSPLTGQITTVKVCVVVCTVIPDRRGLLGAAPVRMTADNAADFAAQSGGYTARINTQLELAAQHLGLKVTPTLADLLHRLNPGRFTGAVAEGLSRFAEAAVFVMICPWPSGAPSGAWSAPSSPPP